MLNFNNLINNFFIITGPNVIESEQHCLNMAKQLKLICDRFNIIFIFKVSFDKANRTSINSYRGLGFEKGVEILKKIKNELDIPILTDVHETWQVKEIAEIVDIIQIPAFLCRQTDLLEAVAKTNKIIHVKKGQFCSADVLHKCKEKLIHFGNSQIILCERGSMFGYNDLIVDPRNLIWLKSKTNLVSMDITHCLQQPGQKQPDGTICSGGLREFITYMGKMAVIFDVNGIFIEVHDNPDKSLCDAPTQFSLNNFENYLEELTNLRYFIKNENIKKITKNKKYKNITCFIPARFNSSRLPGKPLLKINDKTIIQRVYEQVKKSKLINTVIVLTDDEKIKNNIEEIGGKCEFVFEECLNGTERIIKYIQKNKNCCDLIVNVQGDEPFIDPNNIDNMIQTYLDNNDENIKCSTLHYKINNNEIEKKSTGKLVLDKNNNILYCSRNIIPSGKNENIIKNHQYYGHAGLFVFDKNYLLNEFITENTNYQLAEDIEWLKILEQGYKIKSTLIDFIEKSIDTPEDYEYLKNKYTN